MKRLFPILLAFTLLLSFGCSKDDFVPVGYKMISPKSADYRMYVPEDWQTDISTGITAAYVSDNDRASVSFTGYEVNDAIIQVSVKTTGEASSPAETNENGQPIITTAEQYWDYFEGEFSKTFGDMTYEVRGENCIVSGKESEKYIYTATVTGAECKFMQTVTLYNGYVYVFTYSSPADGFDSHYETVCDILGYIELK